MNFKVAGLGGVAAVAFMASIYWIGNLGPATNPTNAMAGFFLFQSYCSIPPVEPGERVAAPVSGGAKATVRAIDARPGNAKQNQVVVIPRNDPKARTVVVVVNHTPLIVHFLPSDSSSTR